MIILKFRVESDTYLALPVSSLFYSFAVRNYLVSVALYNEIIFPTSSSACREAFRTRNFALKYYKE
jgi:hypothetical protein